MVRRWIIRSLALTLLTLCVVAWVGSYWREVYVSDGTHLPFCGMDWGRMYVHWGDDIVIAKPVLSVEPASETDWHLSDELSQYHGFGFTYTFRSYSHLIGAPLWFLTLLSTALIFLVWRKTKPKPIGRAFPIDPAAKPGESKP